jgi:hypothetical protein
VILGDLLDARVLSPDGEPLGHVVDVRLALELLEDDGEVPKEDRERTDPGDRPLAVQVRRREAVGDAVVLGLLISPHTGSSFLGYERTGVHSPWPIAAIVRRRHRGTFLVAWEQVAELGTGEVRLAEGFERLDPRLPSQD